MGSRIYEQGIINEETEPCARDADSIKATECGVGYT
jgi:hypothetical protein